MKHFMHVIVAALVVVGLPTTAAQAQSGAGLLLRPFDAEAFGEVDFSTLYFDSAEVENTRTDASLAWYEASGRMNLASLHEPGAAVGFRLDHLDFDVGGAASGMVPDELSHQSFGVGAWLGEWADWEIGVTAGGGYAGSEPYEDSDAWFAHANLVARHQVDEQSHWFVTINYDQSRTIFPDVPLPGVGYQRRVSDRLVYTIGLPFSTIFWRPTDALVINASYLPPFDGEVKVTYAISQQVRLFGAYESELLAFHTEQQRENDRTFFEQRRVEGGVRWVPCDYAELVLAGGLAFDQELSRGFDARDLTDEVELGDEPYIRGGIKVKF